MGYIAATVDREMVKVWERVNGQRVTKLYPPIAEFLIRDPQGMSRSLYGEPLRKLTFQSLKDLRYVREQYKEDKIEMFESDINPAIKVLSKHYYGARGEKIHTTFLDIENDYDPEIGYASIDNPYAPINAIALYHEHTGKSIVLAVPPRDWDGKLDPTLRKLADIRLFETEDELLETLLNEIEDSDALCGWNSNMFDFPYIAKRLEMRLGKNSVARLSFPDAQAPQWRDQELYGQVHKVIKAGGRILADYMLLYKKFEQGERESYRLDAIADTHLPDLPKLTFTGTLAELYHNDFNHFLRYNIRDTEILKGFEEELGYMDLAVVMFRQATGLFENVTGTVRLADYSIYNYCHHVLNVHVPDIKNNNEEHVILKGAHVLDPTPGMYDWIGSVDVASLYPSCIRSINISPETVIGQFMGYGEDVIEINAKSEKKLCFKDESTGQILTETAATWHELFDVNNCAISGHGTVFTMDKQGVMPAILEGWFNQRIDVNNKIAQIEQEIKSITSQYSSK